MEQKVGDKYSWISLSNSHKSGYYLQDIKTYAPHSTWNDRTTTCTSTGCVKTVHVHIKIKKSLPFKCFAFACNFKNSEQP